MFTNIKSVYVLRFIIKEHLRKKSYFKLAQYNKTLQKKLEINLKTYKEDYKRRYNRIELELIPISKLVPDKNYFFIRIREKKDYYHIYFNDDKNNEIKRSYLTYKDNINKITIKLDMEIRSLAGLFTDCTVIKEIKFTKFNRENFNDLNGVFYGCTFLDKLDIIKFKTSNVKNMNWMFAKCESIKELNILIHEINIIINMLNFDTSKVTEMMCLFSGCYFLKELKFNFNTKNVTNMRNMFYKCKSLTELDVSNFDTTKVKFFNEMFYECINLNSLNLTNFKLVNKFPNVVRMFGGCNEALEKYIRTHFKIFDIQEAFETLQ